MSLPNPDQEELQRTTRDHIIKVVIWLKTYDGSYTFRSSCGLPTTVFIDNATSEDLMTIWKMIEREEELDEEHDGLHLLDNKSLCFIFNDGLTKIINCFDILVYIINQSTHPFMAMSVIKTNRNQVPFLPRR